MLTRAAFTVILLCIGCEDARVDAVPEVRFSRERGFCETPFELALSAEGAAIRYTTDGATPTAGRGALYDTPIPIGATTVVRAVAVAGGAVGAVATHTFIFPAHVGRQPARPAGYLTSVVSERKGPSRAQTFDYAMDARVLGDPASGDIASHLRDLPSLAVALPVADFNLIYANHRRRGVEWERAASVELIYPGASRFAGFAGFQIDCGIRSHGGLAVDQARKKSFRLLFKRQYGEGKLRYPLFESAVHHAHSATDRFDTVVLRAGGNTNWSKDDAWKHASSTYVRDQLVRDTEIAMRGIGARGIFVHLWLNGLYFGLYNICERPDAKFLATYFGGQRSEFCSVNHHGLVDGDDTRWRQLLTAARRSDATAVRALLDVDGFSDYVLLNWAVGMGDWPYNNWYAGARAPSGKFTFLCWDAELAFWARAGYHYSHPGARVSPLFRRSSAPIPLLWRALERDPDFLLAFADRVARHCGEDGALSDDAMRSRFQRLAAAVETAIVAESARWGDAAWGNESRPRTRERDWYPNRDAVLAMIDGNRDRLVAALRAAGYYPRIDPPRIRRLSDPAVEGALVSIAAPGGTGDVFYTTDGVDPRQPGTGATAASAHRVEEGPIRISVTTRVRARVRHRGEWSALADELVLVGRATPPLCITEVMYRPAGDSEALEFVEIRNTSTALVDLTGMRLTGVGHHFAPGATVPGGGVLVLIPDDDPAAFSARYPSVAVAGVYRGHLSNDGEEVRLVDRDGATVCSVAYRCDGPWPAEAAAGGRSLELTDGAGGEHHGPASWRASETPGGTPGR